MHPDMNPSNTPTFNRKKFLAALPGLPFAVAGGKNLDNVTNSHYLPSLEYLYRMHMYYTKTWFVELEAENGIEGQFYGILEGTVEGEKITGKFHIANYPRRRTDKTFLPDAFGALETDEGATIMLNLNGVSSYPDPEETPHVLFGIQHFTGADNYLWLNQAYCVAVGEMLPADNGTVKFIYDIAKVKWEPRPE